MRRACLASVVASALTATLLPGVGLAASAAEPSTASRQIPAPVGTGDLEVTDPSTSDDGRFTAFAGRVGQESGLYRYDSTNGVTERVPTRVHDGELDGHFAETAISGDGRLIAFTVRPDPAGIEGPARSQVYLVDTRHDDIRLMSADSEWEPGNGDSFQPTLSGDGKFLAFVTRASNVINGDGREETKAPGTDIALRHLDDGRIDGVSEVVPGADALEPTISRDGSRVAHTRTLRGASSVWLFERPGGVYGPRGTLSRISEGDQPSLSADGNFLALRRTGPEPFMGRPRLGAYLRELRTGAELQVDVDDEGAPLAGSPSRPRVSGDGSQVLVSATHAGSTDLWVRDVAPGSSVRLATDLATDRSSRSFVLSADGSRVVHVDGGAAWWTDRGLLPAPVRRAPEPLVNPLVQRAAVPAGGAGYVLRVDPAAWEPMRATRIDRQWLRNGRRIRGATGLTYEITPADIGRDLAVRERLVVPGLPHGVVTSRALRVKPDRSVLKAPKKLRQARGKKVVVRVRVTVRPGGESYVRSTAAPQGKVRVRLGKRTAVAKVGRDGRVKLRLRAPRPGKYQVRIVHRGTAYVTAARPRRVPLIVRRGR